MDEELTYESAAAELQRILDGLESGETGIDELAAQVERAGELLKFCNGKLRDTELRVNKIIEELGL